MSDHAKLSPSAAHRWRNCPGSVREEANYVRDPSVPNNPSAVDGTHTHTLLDHCLKTACNDAFSLAGMLLSDHEGHFIVDRERAERAQFALDYIIRRRNEFGNGCSVASESQVSLKRLTGRDDLDGTVDVALYNGDVLEIIDYKDGVGEVSAIENQQLEQYAFGVLNTMPEGVSAPKMIRMTIVQPKLRMFGKDGIGVWNITYDDFMARLPQLTADALATDDPNAPLIPGEKQCQWCKHKSNCEALSSQVMSKIGMEFNKIPMIVQAAELPTPKDFDNQRLRQLIEAMPMITGWLETVEEEALRRLEGGDKIDGIKAVRGRGSRSWALDDEAIEAKLNKMGVPKGEIWQTKLISVSQLEKLSWTNRAGENKSLTPKQKSLVESELVATSQGSLKVVSAADKRPAVEFVKAESEFDKVESLPSWLA
jgi:hypothetical protein